MNTTPNDQSINSNVNINFKPSSDQGEKKTIQPRTKPSYAPRGGKTFHDPKMNSEKYIAHRYEEQKTHNVKIKPGEEPVIV